MAAEPLSTPTLPPYLFRAASNESRGLNTEDTIDPLYPKGKNLHYEDLKYHADLGSIAFDTARQMIYGHLNYQYYTLSEFSSWSVSLLFVLVHAIRKSFSEGEKDVLIYVLDTSRLPASRIHCAIDLIKPEKYNLWWAHYGQTKTDLHKYVYGEYLIHGKLNNDDGTLWSVVDIDQLLDAGFREAFRPLMVPQLWHLHHQRLHQLRCLFFNRDGHVWSLKFDSLTDIKNMARLFGRELEGMVFLALISDRRRDLSADGIAAIAQELGSMRMPKLPWDKNKALRTIYQGWQGVPEAQQFMQILRLLHDRQTEYEDVNTSEAAGVVANISERIAHSPKDVETVSCEHTGADIAETTLPFDHQS